MGDQANADVAFMWDVIRRDHTRPGRLTDDHARYLLDHLGSEHEQYVRTWAQSCFSEAMKEGAGIDVELEEQVIATLVKNLDDPEPRVRINTIASIEEAGLLRREPLREAVKKLERDTVPDVAWRVRRIDWTKEWNGGDGG